MHRSLNTYECPVFGKIWSASKGASLTLRLSATGHHRLHQEDFIDTVFISVWLTLKLFFFFSFVKIQKSCHLYEKGNNGLLCSFSHVCQRGRDGNIVYVVHLVDESDPSLCEIWRVTQVLVRFGGRGVEGLGKPSSRLASGSEPCGSLAKQRQFGNSHWLWGNS